MLRNWFGQGRENCWQAPEQRRHPCHRKSLLESSVTGLQCNLKNLNAQCVFEIKCNAVLLCIQTRHNDSLVFQSVKPHPACSALIRPHTHTQRLTVNLSFIVRLAKNRTASVHLLCRRVTGASLCQCWQASQTCFPCHHRAASSLSLWVIYTCSH